MNKSELIYISGFWLDRNIVREIDRIAGNEMSRDGFNVRLIPR